MSVEATTWVWDHSGAPPIDRFVLMCLADYADKAGANARPSAATIARRTGLSERQVRRSLSDLRDSGAITSTGTHKSGVTVYQIQMPLTHSHPPDTQSPLTVSHPPPDCVSSDPPLNHHVGVSNETPTSTANGNHKNGEAVRRVYDHWRLRHSKTDPRYEKISPERGRKIQSRLKDGFTPEDLCRALDAAAADDWPDRKKHNDLLVLFRSREKVDAWLERNGNGSRPCIYGGSRGLTVTQLRRCGCHDCKEALA